MQRVSVVCIPMRHQYIGVLPYTRTGRTPQREVHGRRKGTVSGDSPTERNTPASEQLFRWAPVQGSVRREPGTNQ